MYVHRYKVAGNGAFPLDMLRYDQSFPRTDSGGLHQDDAELERREVDLCHYDLRASWTPTNARWSSLGWIVVTGSHESERVKG